MIKNGRVIVHFLMQIFLGSNRLRAKSKAKICNLLLKTSIVICNTNIDNSRT